MRPRASWLSRFALCLLAGAWPSAARAAESSPNEAHTIGSASADPATGSESLPSSVATGAAPVDKESAPALPAAVPEVTAAGAAGPTTDAAADSLALPSSDSFSNEETSEAEQQHRLDLYGFADLSYTRALVPKTNPWTRVLFPTNSFAVGNFNLYLNSNLGDSWRALGEVRFMYLPNGATTTSSDGTVQRTDTTVPDYAAFEEPIHWGGIRIERLWVEHEFSSLFKLQVGAFLTPYGIWNVDHGSPAIIPVRAPFAVVDNLFPAHQMGLQLYGNHFFDPFEIGYHLTLSNGRGPVDYVDFNQDKAVGGRLYLKTEAFGSLTVGSSIYRGGYYDRAARYVVLSNNGQPYVDQQFTTTTEFEELSFGADLKWQWKRLLVQSEYIMNEVAFTEQGRPRLQVLKPPQGLQSDYRRWGMYGLFGYRTQFFQTMPYVLMQYVFAPDNPVLPPIYGANFGLNIRPTPAVVLKLEVTFSHTSSPGSIGLGNYPLRYASSQVAWAF